MPPHVGGVEQVAALLARVYEAAGHEVTWVACATPELPGTERDGSITRVRLRALNFLEARAMPFPVPLSFGPLAAAVRAADVVHLHDCLYLTSVAADWSALRAGRPTLVTQHVGMVSFGGGAVDPFLFAAYRTVGRGVLRRAVRVVFVGEAVRDWFLRHVDPSLRASLVPNAVDTARFQPISAEARAAARAALALPTDRPVVLFAGRLVPKKNLRVLAEAMEGTGAQLLVVGDGPEAGALGGRPHVRHVPRLAHERMPEAYAAANLFALPSVGEGMPASLAEALASGLVCLVSRDRPFDALDDCEGVTRADPTPAALRVAIGSLLATSENDLARRSAAARTWAVERYGMAAFSRRYLVLVSEALERRRERR
jgi:D-inositol-3-phosphate glycosyltransferase